jgi:serine phosphatase RsbU (regulator of sigma subunit)
MADVPDSGAGQEDPSRRRLQRVTEADPERGTPGAPGERFEDMVPGWMFVAAASPLRFVIAAVAAGALVAPLPLLDDPTQYRPGPLLVLAVVVAAGAGGWSAAALAGLITVVAYWWWGVPPNDSFALHGMNDAASVGGMIATSAFICVLARRVQRSVKAVQGLDDRRQTHAAAAERAAAQVQDALDLSVRLAGEESMAAVATAFLAGLHIPGRPTTASVGIVDGVHLRILAAHGATLDSLEALQRADLTKTRWLRDVLAGEPAYVDDREEFARENPKARVLYLYPSGSWAVIPFRSEGTIGLLSVQYLQPQALSEHASYFSLVAEILASALDRARAQERQHAYLAELEQSFAERDRIARTLSTTLLPPHLPNLPGCQVAGWVLPGSSDEVAGDFYDVFTSGDDWVAVLGDVCGKGAEAAAVTSLARYAARVAALDDPDPVHITSVANLALHDDPSDLFCTMAVVRHLRATGEIDVTLAGHHQVRLLSEGRVRRIGAYSPVLGMVHDVRTSQRHPFGPGDALVLFSDGLVERHPDFGEDQLDDVLARLESKAAPVFADALRAAILDIPAERTDDLTALVITRDS